jgi:hypothetical protein
VDRSSVPMSVKLFGVAISMPPSSMNYIIGQFKHSEITLDRHISPIGKKRLFTPPHAVVETRFLISQLESRKPQETRCVSRAAKTFLPRRDRSH